MERAILFKFYTLDQYERIVRHNLAHVAGVNESDVVVERALLHMLHARGKSIPYAINAIQHPQLCEHDPMLTSCNGVSLVCVILLITAYQMHARKIEQFTAETLISQCDKFCCSSPHFGNSSLPKEVHIANLKKLFEMRFLEPIPDCSAPALLEFCNLRLSLLEWEMMHLLRNTSLPTDIATWASTWIE